ncbi:MAG: sugar ABC transporter substrate-binding protein [Alkalibacterium sp.]|nr:sugar ABC transporter substrate-binding protein [Alkalibacterium sp.]
MNWSKNVLSTGFIMASALVLSACGGNGDTEGASPSDEGDANAGNDENISLTFMFRGGTDERDAYDLAIAAFEDENPNVSVNVIATDPDQYATQLQASISGNDVPDVFYVGQGDVMAYVDNGILRDITEDVENIDIDLDNIWEYGIDSYRYDGDKIGEGAIYGLPKDVGPFAFGYNKTMFEEAGIELPDPDVPYTWDEFIEVGKELTAEDQWATGLNVNWSLQSFVWSNGGNFINEDLTEVTVNTPEFIEALQYFADMQNVHGLTPSVEQAQTLDTYQRWMNGELAFFPVGPWDMSTFNELDFEYDLLPWPAGKTGESATWVGSLGIAVSEATEHPEVAVELAAYLSASPDAQQQLVDANIQIPNNIEVAEEWASDTESLPNNKQEFLDIVGDYGKNLPAAKTYTSEWYDEFFINVQPVIDGDMSAEEFVENIQPRMQDLLDQSIMQHEQSKQ